MHSGGAGPGRPAGRQSTSAAASPSSSSSASQLGFESLPQQQQQQQQQQQLGSRQTFQQQLLRKPEGNEAFLSYQAGRQGVFGNNNFQQPNAMQLPQQSRKFTDLAQHGSNQDAHLRGQNSEQQQMLNPVHQAYLQYAFQAAQQKPTMGIHPQQHTKMGMLNPASVKDQEMRMGNLKMQDIMAMQALNQAQGSSSRNSSEHNVRGEKQMEQGQQIRPIQTPEAQHGIQNVMNSQIAVAAQLQAMQAWARENNIDLSHPTNAHLMAKLIPLMQSRMVLPPKTSESNIGAQSSSVPVSKQQVNSPAVASESSAHANSSSDMSGQSGSSKARQTVPPSHLGSTANVGTAGQSSDMVMQQFNVHGKESQAPPRQQVKAGNGMPSYHSQQSSATMNSGADHDLNAKGSSSGAEPPQTQYTRQLNQSTTQAGGPTKEGGSGNYAKSQGAPAQMPERQNGFTKQQLHVLKAQILAFRRLKVASPSLFSLSVSF